MAKLKSNIPARGGAKLPAFGNSGSATSGGAKISVPRDASGKTETATTAGSVLQALKFGNPHTKEKAGVGSGSQWLSALNSASGGVSGFLGGGLFSGGAFSFVGKLLGLFGGSKSTPVAPTPFQSPVSQHSSLNVTVPGAASSESVGVHALNVGTAGGVYQQNGSTVPGHYAQSDQVVQIVKQALLTSSSLNDVVSEI